MSDQPQDPKGSRPAPQFGEYAPDGWEWKPPTEQSAARPSGQTSGRVPGVPHNLGAPTGAGAPPQQTAPPAPPASPTGDPPPYRADDPAPRRPQAAQAPQQAPYRTAAPGSTPEARSRRTGDRAFTIVLLGIGAFGAIYLALMLFSIPQSLNMVSQALELEGFQLPGWVGTASTLCALGVFLLYALTLIWSIQRMRARKSSFWIPLAAGVLSVILTFVAVTAIMMGIPELLEAFSDPNAAEKVLEYASTVQP